MRFLSSEIYRHITLLDRNTESPGSPEEKVDTRRSLISLPPSVKAPIQFNCIITMTQTSETMNYLKIFSYLESESNCIHFKRIQQILLGLGEKRRSLTTLNAWYYDAIAFCTVAALIW